MCARGSCETSNADRETRQNRARTRAIGPTSGFTAGGGRAVKHRRVCAAAICCKILSAHNPYSLLRGAAAQQRGARQRPGAAGRAARREGCNCTQKTNAAGGGWPADGYFIAAAHMCLWLMSAQTSSTGGAGYIFISDIDFGLLGRRATRLATAAVTFLQIILYVQIIHRARPAYTATRNDLAARVTAARVIYEAGAGGFVEQQRVAAMLRPRDDDIDFGRGRRAHTRRSTFTTTSWTRTGAGRRRREAAAREGRDHHAHVVLRRRADVLAAQGGGWSPPPGGRPPGRQTTRRYATRNGLTTWSSPQLRGASIYLTPAGCNVNPPPRRARVPALHEPPARGVGQTPLPHMLACARPPTVIPAGSRYHTINGHTVAITQNEMAPSPSHLHLGALCLLLALLAPLELLIITSSRRRRARAHGGLTRLVTTQRRLTTRSHGGMRGYGQRDRRRAARGGRRQPQEQPSSCNDYFNPRIRGVNKLLNGLRAANTSSIAVVGAPEGGGHEQTVNYDQNYFNIDSKCSTTRSERVLLRATSSASSTDGEFEFSNSCSAGTRKANPRLMFTLGAPTFPSLPLCYSIIIDPGGSMWGRVASLVPHHTFQVI